MTTPDHETTRRELLRRTATLSLAAISARGVYEVLEELGGGPARAAAAPPRRRQEQYLVDNVEIILDNGVTVAIPPLYNDVITARLTTRTTWTVTALKKAKTRVETALAAVEAPYSSNAAGLTMVVGWGLPFFRTFVPSLWPAYLPAIPGADPRQYAVLDAIRFPSDDASTVLEDNHVMFKFRSDSSAIVSGAERALFEDQNSKAYIGDLFDLTSKRIGFLGRGFDKPSIGRTLALAAGVPGAGSIPDRAQLMMGFTSTQTQALAPDNIPSFETLPGVTDQWPSGYFAAGCAMHLSHLYLDIDTWYRSLDFSTRTKRMFSPRTPDQAAGTVTVPNGPAQVASLTEVKQDAANLHQSGHNSLLQLATRLGADVTDNYGRVRTKGAAVPLREDFNTLDDPFSWAPGGVGPADKPGLHFVAFVPGHHLFHRARLAMDGVLPDGTDLRQAPYSIAARDSGINAMMRASHRQNYVIPPRRNRSFPLAELLT
ncbi:hypothetical protein GCM10020358_59620 [Amorphoplanes nipponensis]|uniref:Uncharacterized protein n=1 Tax=Actinoplanes nipponensis TaxID=135950 RepID=A0A919MRH2_9ACTN|nr:hypothetical protein [Actinoplanes nipponensis]GIE46940.1 hypothetical protein Ani05nite_04740 [Actinoplanes nipponensis]